MLDRKTRITHLCLFDFASAIPVLPVIPIRRKMVLVTKIFCILVALEVIFIFYLETLATTSKKTAKTFGVSVQSLESHDMNVSMKNQGVYNLGIAVLLLLAVFLLGSKTAVIGLLVYIIAVAAYGSFTVDRMIILKQGGLAIIALLACLL